MSIRTTASLVNVRSTFGVGQAALLFLSSAEAQLYFRLGSEQTMRVELMRTACCLARCKVRYATTMSCVFTADNRSNVHFLRNTPSVRQLTSCHGPEPRPLVNAGQVVPGM